MAIRYKHQLLLAKPGNWVVCMHWVSQSVDMVG